MNTHITFCCDYYSEKIEMELNIWYDITDFDPEVGVDWEFEWEALDENGIDRKDDISAEEHTECQKRIYRHIIESEYDDGL